jgi:hypothetical protein
MLNFGNMLAPIALFVYNRLWHTEKTVESLKMNLLANDSELFVFSDGAKNDEDAIRVNEVRSYLKTITGFRRIRIIERLENFGLAKSIINGVTEVVSKYGKIIVLEDDLETSHFFLQFMNDGLSLYESEKDVISIHGYIYPVKTELPETFFLKGADCWGWGTWKHGWDLFEFNGKKLLFELKKRKLTHEFDFYNAYPYTKMLEDQIVGNNDSWAIRWQASAFLKDKLTLYPCKSLVKNFGFDGSGKHCGCSKEYLVDVYNGRIDIKKIKIGHNLLAFNLFRKFFLEHKNSFFRKVFNKLKIYACRYFDL